MEVAPVPCGMANGPVATLVAILAANSRDFVRFRPRTGRAAILELPLVSGNSGGNSGLFFFCFPLFFFKGPERAERQF